MVKRCIMRRAYRWSYFLSGTRAVQAGAHSAHVDGGACNPWSSPLVAALGASKGFAQVAVLSCLNGYPFGL